MSVILDALKKLDREKSSRRNGTANIAVEILRPDLPRPGKKAPLYFVTLTLTAVTAAAITYALVEFNLFSKSSPSAPTEPHSAGQQVAPDSLNSAKTLPPVPINPPAPSQQASPAPLNSSSQSKLSAPLPIHSPAPSQQVLPAPVNSDSPSKSSPPAIITPPAPSQQVAPVLSSQEPIPDARNEISRVPPKIDTQAEIKNPNPSPGEKETSQKVTLERATVAPGNAGQHTEQTSIEATTPPSLRLSAIVWHEEPSKRIAMINGMISTEGSVIEGMKVEEIYPNRVRLSQNGRPFEILLK
jgi:general secretion pathway protein B